MQKALRMENNFSLTDRTQFLKHLVSDGIFRMTGKDLPDIDDPSDPIFYADIIVANNGACLHLEFDDESLGPITTDIPSLTTTNSWSKSNISYLKHWVNKVLDDPRVFRANVISIVAVGGWNKKTVLL